MFFVASYDAQIEIRSEFSVEDLKHMPSLGTFAAEFANTTTHADQKRSIVRSALIDQFRPRHAATLGELIHSFEAIASRSEEHTSELQSLMRISYAVFCLKKKKQNTKQI